jgi:hypothetical protein
VVEVKFDAARRRLDLRIDFRKGARFACPECGAAPGTSFALTVAISGDTIAVGEGGHGTNGVAYSTVCVFTKPPGGWAGQVTQAVTLTPPSGSRSLSEEFGRAVALDGDTLAVGNDSHAVGGGAAGAAYVY